MKRKAAALLALAFAGCAHVTELPDGSRRVAGLVSITVPPAIAAERRGADRLDPRPAPRCARTCCACIASTSARS